MPASYEEAQKLQNSMKMHSKVIAALCFLLCFQSCNETIMEDYSWVDQYKAIICLTYDDGMVTQYKNAIPYLDSFDIKGTFFINNVTEREAIAAWRDASQNGHELGNHTLFHPCPRSFGWEKEVTIENYTVDRILDEVKTVNAILDVTELEKRTRTFAYPCNNTFIGDSSYKEPLQKSNLISYARSGSFDQEIFDRNDASINLMNAPSWIVTEGTSFEELKEYVDKVANQNAIGILQFHGIGGEWISISNEAHYKLIEYLDRNKDDILVTTFIDLMKYLESSRLSK